RRPLQPGLVHTMILLAVITDLGVLGLIIYGLRPRRRRKRSDELELYVDERPPVHWAWKLLATILPFLILVGLVLIVVVVRPPACPPIPSWSPRLPPAHLTQRITQASPVAALADPPNSAGSSSWPRPCSQRYRWRSSPGRPGRVTSCRLLRQ